MVLKDRRAVADPAAEAGTTQPAVDDMQVDDRACALGCGGEEFGPGKRDTRLGERGDRQPVPRGDDLVVAAGLRPAQPGGHQRGAYPLETLGIIRVGGQLQHRTAVLECSCVCHVEKRCGPTSVVVSQHFAQLRGRPDVGQPLAAVGVGVQRRGEHTARTQPVDNEPRGFVGDLVRQRI